MLHLLPFPSPLVRQRPAAVWRAARLRGRGRRGQEHVPGRGPRPRRHEMDAPEGGVAIRRPREEVEQAAGPRHAHM